MRNLSMRNNCFVGIEHRRMKILFGMVIWPCSSNYSGYRWWKTGYQSSQNDESPTIGYINTSVYQLIYQPSKERFVSLKLFMSGGFLQAARFWLFATKQFIGSCGSTWSPESWWWCSAPDLFHWSFIWWCNQGRDDPKGFGKKTWKLELWWLENWRKSRGLKCIWWFCLVRSPDPSFGV